MDEAMAYIESFSATKNNSQRKSHWDSGGA
jgi:hypothetical protein